MATHFLDLYVVHCQPPPTSWPGGTDWLTDVEVAVHKEKEDLFELKDISLQT